ncbi:unnamed protein product [Mucor circinelloides]
MKPRKHFEKTVLNVWRSWQQWVEGLRPSTKNITHQNLHKFLRLLLNMPPVQTRNCTTCRAPLAEDRSMPRTSSTINSDDRLDSTVNSDNRLAPPLLPSNSAQNTDIQDVENSPVLAAGFFEEADICFSSNRLSMGF